MDKEHKEDTSFPAVSSVFAIRQLLTLVFHFSIISKCLLLSSFLLLDLTYGAVLNFFGSNSNLYFFLVHYFVRGIT